MSSNRSKRRRIAARVAEFFSSSPSASSSQAQASENENRDYGHAISESDTENSEIDDVSKERSFPCELEFESRSESEDLSRFQEDNSDLEFTYLEWPSDDYHDNDHDFESDSGQGNHKEMFENQASINVQFDEFKNHENMTENPMTSDPAVVLPPILAQWASSFKIRGDACNALLSILVPYFPFLPKDSRTLKKTQRKIDVDQICDGEYYHFGLLESLSVSMKNIPRNMKIGVSRLSLQINIDGLPLFKSTGDQFWPILARVCHPFKTPPFLVGLFYGTQKPYDVDSYFKKFVDDVEYLLHNTVWIDGFDDAVEIEFNCFVCDRPARSLVKQIKGHNGYFGCDKCMHEGVYKNKRMLFPVPRSSEESLCRDERFNQMNEKMKQSLRTDTNFRQMSQQQHHVGISPLTNLGIKMVSAFPIDYMHSVCLGVMKKMLSLWTKSEVSKNIRLGRRAINSMSRKLLDLSKYIPREFSRKSRSLNDLDRWKATEFRQFLLYTGPVVLKDKFQNSDFYKHFLMLSTAIFILVNPDVTPEQADWAHKLLFDFVAYAPCLYGKDFVVYNVHSLLHLAEDVKLHGCLDSYSAFCFETYLGQIKKLISKPNNVLVQVVKRVKEQRQFVFNSYKMSEDGIPKYPYAGPTPDFLANCRQFQQVCHKGFVLTVFDGNNCIRLKSGNYGLVRNIVLNDSGLLLVFQKFSRITDFYSLPFLSSEIGVVEAGQLSGVLSTVELVDIECKCVGLPFDDRFVLTPLYI